MTECSDRSFSKKKKKKKSKKALAHTNNNNRSNNNHHKNHTSINQNMAGKKGGKGQKSKKKSGSEPSAKRDLVIKEEGQEYAQVLRMLGNGRLEAYCYDGKNRLCHIRGKMRKKIWIAQGDTVLIGLRDFQDDKADVIHKYTPDEARQLKKEGHLPADAKINETAAVSDGIEFGDEEGEEDELDIDFEDI